jgi:hypothetical protein
MSELARRQLRGSSEMFRSEVSLGSVSNTMNSAVCVGQCAYKDAPRCCDAIAH